MRLFTKHIKVFTALALILFMNQLQASLLVAPTRITFEERTRSQKLTLINDGDDVRTYRLSWSHKTALPTNGYSVIDDKKEIESFNKASNMIRYSPKQVTLQPGEKQKVALSLRRPKSLSVGEYRSHLNFTQLPQAKMDKVSIGTGIAIQPLMSYSVPIIVRQGEYNTGVKLTDLEIKKSNKPNALDIKVNLIKTGSFSSFGKITAYWQATGTKKAQRVAVLNDYAIHFELPAATPTLIWTGEQAPFTTSGTLRVIYSGLKEFQNKTWDEKRFKITPDMILPL